MELRFWIDPVTDLPHIFDHGVTEEEVLQVMTRTGEEIPGTDNSRIRIGQTEAERYLQVVHVPDSSGLAYLREEVMSSLPVQANEFVRPAVRWSGTISDAGKKKAMPELGVITWREPFAELWAAWELGTEAPQVDFESYFVVVMAGPHADGLVHLNVDGKGHGRAVVKSGPEPMRQGFGYSIGVFPRAGITAGIKTYQDRDVAKREES